MNHLTLLFILAAMSPAQTAPGTPPASADHRFPEGIEVYTCDFEAESDTDYDLWPDRWTRRIGQGFPRYLKVAIADHEDEPIAPGHRALICLLNGGSIAATSPLVEINAVYSYILEGYVRTDGLAHNSAYLTLSFYDAARRQLETSVSRKVTGTGGWERVQIGPMTPSHEQARFASIGICVDGAQRTDIQGKVWFDDLWFGRFPQISLESNQPCGFHTDPADVRVHCRASGIATTSPVIDFELYDALGQLLAQETIPAVGIGNSLRRESLDGRAASPARETAALGLSEWHPPIPDFGFYRIKASMPGRNGSRIERELNLSVGRACESQERGEFGWCLPSENLRLPPGQLIPLLRQAGIHWVKYPIWSQGERATDDELLQELLKTSPALQLIGVLDQPPPAVRSLLDGKGHLPIASVFTDPQIWRAAIDPVMTRLGTRIKYWQLGADDDISFLEFPQLESRVRDIREHARRFGQETEVGFPWPTIQQLPSHQEKPSWGFLSLLADPQFTSDELRDYLAELPLNQTQYWISLDPLPKDAYSTETRVRDLVCRLLTAKQQLAQGVFLKAAIDSRTGVLSRDGQTNELFLPWRTTASLLSGTQYWGRITLPGGSQNLIFGRDKQVILVAWNDEPTTERLYLGEDIWEHDVWGRQRRSTVEAVDGFPVQTIQTGRMPIFVTGLNPEVARVRLRFQFQQERLASVFGREQPLGFQFTNPFRQGLQGEVTWSVPAGWDVSPRRNRFRVGPLEDFQDATYVVFGADAQSGEQPVRADFRVSADRDYRFSVHGTLHVGMGDVTVELTSRLDEHGNLIVEQHLTNNTDQPVSFNCYLFPPERRRLRRQAIQIGKERTTLSYLLPDGRDLIGKTIWLRAEEIDGARILNVKLVAEP